MTIKPLIVWFDAVRGFCLDLFGKLFFIKYIAYSSGVYYN